MENSGIYVSLRGMGVTYLSENFLRITGAGTQ